MKRYHPILIGLGIGMLLLCIFFYQFILRMSQPLSIFHNDAYLMAYVLKHYISLLNTGDISSWISFSMFYGFKNSVFFAEFFPIHAVIGYPMFILTNNIFLVSNALVLMTVYFSYGSMFLLSWYSTRRMWPSVVSGVIFSLNPFLMARFPDHILLLNVGFIPLIVLALEYIIVKNHRHGMFFLFCLFCGQLLTSSIYYSVFLSVMVPLYAGIRCLQIGFPSKKSILNLSAVLGVAIFLIVSSAIVFIYTRANNVQEVHRSVSETMVYSATVSDWFFTAPNNILYGSLKPLASKAFPSIVREGIYSEHNLFPGIIPALLALYGAWVFFFKKRDARMVVFGIIGILSWILSLGPQISLSESYHIPGLYGVLYFAHPLFVLLRVPARFAVFVFLAISVLSAYALAWLEDSVSKKKYAILLVVLILGIYIEYRMKPVEFLTQRGEVKKAYAMIQQRSDIQVLLEYPIGNSIDYAYPQARMEELDAHYLAYALLYHNKKLINGYSGFIPKEYYKRTGFLSINFPTRSKLATLKTWGVGAIVVHEDEFTIKRTYADILSSLTSLGVPILMSEKGVTVFDLTAWQADP